MNSGVCLRKGNVQTLEPLTTTVGIHAMKDKPDLSEETDITVLSNMTFWSRYDPVAQPRGNTDHWTKLKQRAVQHRAMCMPGGIGSPLSLDGLQGNMPGTYMYSRPRNVVNRDTKRNIYHDRARDGFRYWLIERPKPTNFGKYGIGSYKTVLGVGNAPRT